MALIKPNNSWKVTPVTLGYLGFLVLVVLGTIGLTQQGEGKVKRVALEQIGAHINQDIDASHPTLPKRYVQHRQLNGALHKLDKRMTKIEISQQVSERMLKRIMKHHRIRVKGAKDGN